MARKRRNGTVRIIEPEIVTDENAPLSGTGKLPALQADLKQSVSESFDRCRDAAEQIKRVLKAKADMYEDALKDAKRSYEDARKELKDLGV